MDFSVGVHQEKNSWISVRYVVGERLVTLDSIEVIPEVRGCGLGTRFMRKFIEESPHSIMLTILYGRPLTFYLRLGFHVESADMDPEGEITSAIMVYRKG